MRRMHLSDFYPDAPSTDTLDDFIMSMNWAWWYLVQCGRVASVLLSLALLFKMFKYVAGVVARPFAKPTTPIVLFHVLAAFFPDLADYIAMGRYRPQGPKGPFRELVTACMAWRESAMPEGSSDDEAVRRLKRNQARRKTRRERQNPLRAAAKVGRAGRTSSLGKSCYPKGLGQGRR